MTVTPFFQKISILTSIQKHYTGNKHLFQSFYAFKIKNLSRTSHLSFFPLDYPQQKRKSPVKSLATIGGALHSLRGFLLAVSFCKRITLKITGITRFEAFFPYTSTLAFFEEQAFYHVHCAFDLRLFFRRFSVF